MSTLEEMALTAYQKSLERQKATEEQRIEEATKITAKIFVETFGVYPDKVSGYTVEIGNLKLRRDRHAAVDDYYAPDLSWKWRVSGECDTCGKEVWSEMHRNLEGIGKELTHFQPVYTHRCYDTDITTNRKTPDQKLGDAIRDFIYDVTGGYSE